MNAWTWIDLTEAQKARLAKLQEAVTEHGEAGDQGSILAQVYVGDKCDARCMFLTGEQTRRVSNLLAEMGIASSNESLVGEPRE